MKSSHQLLSICLLVFFISCKEKNENKEKLLIEEVITNNEKKEDSINSIAFNKLINDFSQEKDLNGKLDFYNNFISTYKNDTGYSKSFMAKSIADEYLKTKDYENYIKYANQISDKQGLAYLHNNTAWGLVEKGEDLDFASKISKLSLELNQSSTKVDSLTENESKRNRSQYIMYADTYAYILFKTGKIKEAIAYQEDITRDLEIGKKDPHNLKQRFIEFLVADNQFEKAQSKAELFIKNGDANSSMTPFLKQAYIKNRGSAKGFETYISSFLKESEKVVLEEFKKGMLNDIAPNFKLKNLEGVEVSLSDFKNKVVILDFWATWCGPCVASFPAMQTAVNKYKDNPNIIFLFIDTRERGTLEEINENALNFIKKQQYTFNVLLDTKDQDSDKFTTVTNYNVNGIPTKIIIGTDGKIKFKSVGYSGNADSLVNELDMMIKLAKS